MQSRERTVPPVVCARMCGPRLSISRTRSPRATGTPCARLATMVPKPSRTSQLGRVDPCSCRPWMESRLLSAPASSGPRASLAQRSLHWPRSLRVESAASGPRWASMRCSSCSTAASASASSSAGRRRPCAYRCQGASSCAINERPMERASGVKGLWSAWCSQAQPRSIGAENVVWSVQARPPTRSAASSTSTACPALCKCRAAARPAAPAPMMRVSMVAGRVDMRASPLRAWFRDVRKAYGIAVIIPIVKSARPPLVQSGKPGTGGTSGLQRAA